MKGSKVKGHYDKYRTQCGKSYVASYAVAVARLANTHTTSRLILPSAVVPRLEKSLTYSCPPCRGVTPLVSPSSADWLDPTDRIFLATAGVPTVFSSLYLPEFPAATLTRRSSMIKESQKRNKMAQVNKLRLYGMATVEFKIQAQK